MDIDKTGNTLKSFSTTSDFLDPNKTGPDVPKPDIPDPIPEHDRPEPRKPRPTSRPEPEIVNPRPSTVVNPSTDPEIDYR